MMQNQQAMYQQQHQNQGHYRIQQQTADFGFNYQVSENLRSEMMNELLQIQAYVNEMDELNQKPISADQTQLNLSQQARDDNLSLANSKEREYLKKAVEEFKREPLEQYRSSRISPLKAMQQRIDQIYTEQSKEYVKSKKDRVKAYKNEKIQELNVICEDYAKIKATEFIEANLP